MVWSGLILHNLHIVTLCYIITQGINIVLSDLEYRQSNDNSLADSKTISNQVSNVDNYVL